MRARTATAWLGALLLASCQTVPAEHAGPVPAPAGEDWRSVARPADRDRLARLDAAWEQGLAQARAGGFAGRIAAEVPLLDPGAVLARATLAPGHYRCRLFRLGAGTGRRAFTAYPGHFCFVAPEGRLLAFTKQTGSERPGGYLWEDNDARLVFLGGMGGADRPPPAYGEEEARDLAGIVERVGAFRYRLVIPWPRHGAALDVLELVPALPSG